MSAPSRSHLTLALRVLACCLLAISLPFGCANEAPPVEEKAAPPPPPSKDQLKGEFGATIQTFSQNVTTGLAMETVYGAVNNFKQAHSKVNGQRATNPNAEPALSETKAALEEIIKRARTYDAWRILYGCIECFKVLEPTNSKYKSLEELTGKMLKMPWVTLRGFTAVDGETYGMFEVFDFTTNVRTSFRVREGEEFDSGRFLFTRIIGNQQRAELLYKDADFVLEVGGPRERVTTQGGREVIPK